MGLAIAPIRLCNVTMTIAPATPPRRLACARCGTAFDCGLGGECWCAAEPYRLPLTAAGETEDCLCPACLRKAAALTQT
jgi:hypothetical protein